MENPKTCVVCGLSKAASMFYAGQGNTCKMCNNKRVRQWRKDNPQRYRAAKKSREKKDKDLAVKRRKARLKRRYKLTLTRVEEILESQDRKCAICKVELISPAVRPDDIDGFEDARWAVIDHNHQDGHVRGALCSDCNAGLGLFSDDIKLIRAAYYYMLNDLKKRSGL